MPCATCFQLNVYPGKNSFSQTVTVNTPPFIVRKCSEDCSKVTKFFLSSVEKLFNLVAELELLTSKEKPLKQGEIFRL